MRTLVVEREPDDRRVVAEALRGLGHDVTELGDGPAALQIHEQSPFPLVVLDWDLPGMDGLELCRKVRLLPHGSEPVVVLVSRLDRPQHVVDALKAGANDFISKPFERVALRTRLIVAETSILERVKHHIEEEAILNFETSFRTLVEASPDGIIIHRNGRVSYLNPAVLTFLGYQQPEDLIGRSFLDLTIAADRNDALDQVGTTLLSGKASRAREIRFLRRDGAIVTLEVVSVPLEIGNQSAMAALARDITERKQIETQLIRAERLASVGTLAAGIAHEINNPLSYVIASQQLIAEMLKGMKSEPQNPPRVDELTELLAQAQEGAERVRVIVHDLKSVSQSDNGTHGAVDVHRALEGAIIMARNEILHRAKLEKDFRPVPLVKANEAKLGQVFLNLLVNAAQSLDVGRAAENCVAIKTWTDQSDNAVIEISDTGAGIPESVLDRIFDPFFTTKQIGAGTGLGLSVCYSIITSIDGRITVRSQVGEGTTVQVLLKPAADVAVRPADKPRASEPVKSQRKELRILVIDDEPAVARSLRRALHGHDVTVSLNGREAMEEIKKDPSFDLIFCDLMMPEVSGVELYQEATHQAPGIEQRIIFITGGAFTQRAKDFLESIPNKWLEKPFNIQEIQELVRQRAAV